jgi:hypothetical protein
MSCQNCADAIRVRDLAREASNRDLEAKRQVEQAHNLEPRVAAWVKGRMGPEHMRRQERAARLLEEVIELAQAEGLDVKFIERLTEHVYSRPVGDAISEAAGVATCILGYCQAVGVKFWQLALGELERVEKVPGARILASLRRKEATGLLTVRLAKSQPFEYDPTPEQGGAQPPDSGGASNS